MSLSSQEAAANLSEAEKARQRSAQLYAYHKASPHLVMWGVIWIIGYTCTYFFPTNANPIWLALILIGASGGVVIGRKSNNWNAAHPPYAWRMFALFAIAVFFVAATYTLMWPVHGRQMCAYPVLLTGCIYVAIGLWVGIRYVITGVVVVALTLFGYFYILDYLPLWMAFVGGGSMILAGLWFRTV